MESEPRARLGSACRQKPVLLLLLILAAALALFVWLRLVLAWIVVKFIFSVIFGALRYIVDFFRG